MSLILVMLSIMVLSVLAAAIVFSARSETLASYNWKLDTQADYLAKAGIQYGLNWLRSNRYQAVPATAAVNTFYKVHASGGSYNTYSADTAPVQCVGTSGCSSNSPVRLLSIPNTYSTTCSLSSNYPTSAVSTSVISNFCTDFASSGVQISGSPIDKGVVYLNMVLLNYQTVESGNPPVLTPYPLETWQITARAYWTGGANAVGGRPIAVAEEQAVVQPIYIPIWANAMYGYCSASMGGSSGTCTDAFNSALGAYAGGNNATAASGCNSSSSTNVIDAGAGVGANGFVSLGSNVNVSGNVTIGSSPSGGSACCSGSSCGFQGSTTGVAGQVVAGPNVPTPPMPVFPPNLDAAPDYPHGTMVYPQNCNFGAAITVTPKTVSSPVAGTLASPQTYYYTVTAIFSSTPPQTPTTSGTPPSAPVESAQIEQTAVLAAGQNAVTLSWSSVTGASKYRVYRGTASRAENVYYETTNTTLTDLGSITTDSPALTLAAGAPLGGVAMFPGTTNTMAQPTFPASSPSGGGSLSPSTYYYYLVTALTASGETMGGENFQKTTAGKNTITLDWTAFAGATSYRVYRGLTPLGEAGYISVGSGSTSYTDSGTAALTAGSPPINVWSTFMNGTGANPPFIGCSSPCGDTPCNGTETNPFEIDSLSMNAGDYLELMGGKDIFHPVYYDINDFQETGGSILVSGYVVINVKNSLKIAGNGMANPIDYQTLFGVAVNVPPECVQINYTGTETAQIQGNGAVSAVITAPNATVQLGGGGSGGYMIGAIRAKDVSMQGGYPLHYDVQLSKAGGLIGSMATTAYSRRKF